jgi:hypothetical protein
MKGKSAVIACLVAVLQAATLKDYPVAVVLDEQDVMSPAGFQRSSRLFCVKGTTVEEVKESSGTMPACRLVRVRLTMGLDCLAPSISIHQSWNSLGLSCVVWPAATFLASQMLQVASEGDVVLELGRLLQQPRSSLSHLA